MMLERLPSPIEGEYWSMGGVGRTGSDLEPVLE
jgi:hypothetical protein